MKKDYTSIGEKELITLLQKGDSSAFRAVYDRYVHKIYNFTYSLLRSQDTAQEVTQEVFVKLWECHSNLNPELAFQAYLFAIARNSVYALFRYQFYTNGPLLSIEDSEAFNIPTIEVDIEKNDLLTYFKLLVEKLPSRRKEIFLLSRVSQLTYKQIAQKLGISENTVDTQIRLALNFLRKTLQKEGLQILFFLLWSIKR